MVSFSVKNIKAFSDSGEVQLKPITLLVGKNSCGKSSLLRFPAVLSQTANSDDRSQPISLNGNYLDYGNFEDVVHNKMGSLFSFSLSYNFDITGNSQISTALNKIVVRTRKEEKKLIEKVTVDVTVKRVGRSIKVKTFQAYVGNKLLSELRWDDNNKNYILNLCLIYDEGELKTISESIRLDNSDVSFMNFFPLYEDSYLSSIVRSNNMSINHDSIQKLLFLSLRDRFITEKDKKLSDDELRFLFINRAFSYSADIIRYFYDLFTLEFRNYVAYIGPFRKNPDRIYRFSETARNNVGPKGENIGDFIFQAYQNQVNQKKTSGIFDDISTWLYKYYGYHLEIHDVGNNYFQLILNNDRISSNIIDVGYGISQVLPIISEIALMARAGKRKRFSPINDILLVEQPELHLHPAAQANLAELFTLCVTSNENARIVIETHSEHLISKLQVLIADKDCKLTNDMVQILYVDQDDGKDAFIEEMVIKENGKFANEWPSGFFDQGYNLAYELMKKTAKHS